MNHPHYENARARQIDRARVFEARGNGRVFWAEAEDEAEAAIEFLGRFGSLPETVARI
jgi:hypothetical protein